MVGAKTDLWQNFKAHLSGSAFSQTNVWMLFSVATDSLQAKKKERIYPCKYTFNTMLLLMRMHVFVTLPASPHTCCCSCKMIWNSDRRLLTSTSKSHPKLSRFWSPVGLSFRPPSSLRDSGLLHPTHPPLHQITPWQGLNQSMHNYPCWHAVARASFSRAFRAPPFLLGGILPCLWRLPYLWDCFTLNTPTPEPSVQLHHCHLHAVSSPFFC